MSQYLRWPAVSGGGGSAVWGSITGTITNQTDLIAYLGGNYLKLDQSSQQTVTGGVGPLFGTGLQSGSHITPTTDNVYDLGTSLLRFRHLYVGPGTIRMGENGNQSLVYRDQDGFQDFYIDPTDNGKAFSFRTVEDPTPANEYWRIGAVDTEAELGGMWYFWPDAEVMTTDFPLADSTNKFKSIDISARKAYGNNGSTVVADWSAGSLKINNSYTMPTTDGSSGCVLSTNGSGAVSWVAKQNPITTGTTSQYFRGDLSLATFPTALSSFTNDVGYITCYTPWTVDVCAGGFKLTCIGAEYFAAGDYEPVSSSGHGGLRYNCLLNQFEQSLSGAAWTAFGGGGGGSPGAPTRAVQFNNAGNFCGSDLMLWEDTNCFLVNDQFGDCNQYSAVMYGCACNGTQFQVICSPAIFNEEACVIGYNYCCCACTKMTIGYNPNIGGCGASIWCDWQSCQNIEMYYGGTSINYECYFCINGAFSCGMIDISPSYGIRFHNENPPCAYSFPSCTGCGDCVLAVCSMNVNQLYWKAGSGGGGGSPGGCQYAIQVNDGAGGFEGNCNFTYKYDCVGYFNQIATCSTSCFVFPQICRFEQICCGSGCWLIQSSDNCCGMCGGGGLDVNYQFQNPKNVCCTLVPFNFYVSDYCDNYIKQTPSIGKIVVDYCGQTCCGGYEADYGIWTQTVCGCTSFYHAAYMGTQVTNLLMYQDNCCKSFFHAQLSTYMCGDLNLNCCFVGDYIHFQDLQCGFSGGACCVDSKFCVRNGCTYGWNQWDALGGCGLVINSCSDGLGCGPNPIVFAQETCQVACFNNCGYLEITKGLGCIAGFAPPAPDGTYSSPSSITIRCGIITAIS